jgi:hypothetical protein
MLFGECVVIFLQNLLSHDKPDDRGIKFLGKIGFCLSG